ncbi:hypothetical protein [Streptomyces incanus]|uniref:Uncharacterized protein n=1 Tax=Streptomyces incanus TaxID=887453 RepID=A0ABW0XWE8_9ACTN
MPKHPAASSQGCSGRRLDCFRLRLDRAPPAAPGVCGDLGHPWLEAAGTGRPVTRSRRRKALSEGQMGDGVR